jgi:hypothetical protein
MLAAVGGACLFREGWADAMGSCCGVRQYELVGVTVIDVGLTLSFMFVPCGTGGCYGLVSGKCEYGGDKP